MNTSEQDPAKIVLDVLSVFPGADFDTDTLPRLRQAAEALRAEGRYFAAGFAMSRGITLAWGELAEMEAFAQQAADDFQRAVDESAEPFEAIAALASWRTLLWRIVPGDDPGEHRAAQLSLDQVLAQRLQDLASETTSVSEKCAYLVHGLHISTDFRSGWLVELSDSESRDGVMRFSRESITLSIPSAFEVLVRSGDYEAAQAIVASCPDAFTTPGLRGWRSAVAGFTDPDRAVEHFYEAADHFSQDTPPDVLPRDGWSSINVHLWSRYFRGRSHVAQIIRTPAKASELIRSAREALVGTHAGWVNPQVTCFRVVLDVLDELFAEAHDDVAAETRKELMVTARLSGVDASNAQALMFLDEMAIAYEELRADTASALVSGKLAHALRTLGHIPLFGGQVAEAVAPYVGGRAAKAIEGQQLTWIHKTLEAIGDEATLRAILLRLFQASVPHYAQIRHGPIEYGKDIAALVEIESKPVLTLWQAKVGDMTKAHWPAAAQELEEVFQVPLPGVQLPIPPSRVEGILVFNGHLNPYVEPVVAGWLDEQRRDHGRNIRLMHLNNLASWIVESRLVTEFRQHCPKSGWTSSDRFI